MSFISSILFVFYLQITPPPPPTMLGGGDYWSGTTVDEDNLNNEIIDWTFDDLAFSLLRFDGQFGRKSIGYNGFNRVLDAIEDGFIIKLDINEWNVIFNNAFNRRRFNKACRVASKKGGVAKDVAIQRGCPPEAPLPKRLVFLIMVSFLFITFFHNRNNISNLKEPIGRLRYWWFYKKI